MEAYQAVFKRKEVKYLLTEAQLAALRPALEAHMEPDAFAHSSIYNLYYDTPDYRLIRRSQEKPAYKEKLRLRSYGVPDEETQVFPEIKKKARGIVYKRRVSMPYGDALRYLSRRQSGGDGQIFRELNWLLTSYGSLAPRIFLSYERDSWKGRGDTSLRLTLDRGTGSAPRRMGRSAVGAGAGAHGGKNRQRRPIVAGGGAFGKRDFSHFVFQMRQGV